MINNFYDKVREEGFLKTIYFLLWRIKSLLYGWYWFKRWDIRVSADLRTSGNEYMEIGDNFSMARGGWLECIDRYKCHGAYGQRFNPKLIIGDNVCIGEYVHIGCNNYIQIGNDVLMGSKIYITDHNHGVYRGEDADSPDIPPRDRRLTEGGSVEIGARCWIGEFVTILPGVKIGEGCIIGSHSTVTHDIPANSIAVGSPARVIKEWNKDTNQWESV